MAEEINEVQPQGDPTVAMENRPPPPPGQAAGLRAMGYGSGETSGQHQVQIQPDPAAGGNQAVSDGIGMIKGVGNIIGDIAHFL